MLLSFDVTEEQAADIIQAIIDVKAGVVLGKPMTTSEALRSLATMFLSNEDRIAEQIRRGEIPPSVSCPTCGFLNSHKKGCTGIFFREEAMFEAAREALWQEHPKRWALVKDGCGIQIHSSQDEAFKAGLSRFGTKGHFMIKQILLEDPVITIFSTERT